MVDWKFLFEKYTLRQHRNAWLKSEKQVLRTVRRMHGHLFVDIGCNCKFYPKLLKDNFD